MDVKQRVATSIEEARADLDRALVELQQLPAFDSNTVGFVAHALNNYLTVTLVTMETLQRALITHPNPEVRSWIEGIQHVTEVMQHTVGKLLQVSPAGDFPLKLEAVNVSLLMDRACKYFETVAHRKQISIRYGGVDELPLVRADRVALAVVAENLLSNAVKFSKPGTTIHVQLIEESGSVVCTVRDEGPGISREDQTRLFQKGVTLGAVPTGGEPSSGFGLALAKGFMDQMDGTLWCESEPGHGAWFSFRLPVHE
jgi:signal transduction histidine kinase